MYHCLRREFSWLTLFTTYFRRSSGRNCSTITANISLRVLFLPLPLFKNEYFRTFCYHIHDFLFFVFVCFVLLVLNSNYMNYLTSTTVIDLRLLICRQSRWGKRGSVDQRSQHHWNAYSLLSSNYAVIIFKIITW